MSGIYHQMEDFLVGCIDIHQIHPRSGDHHLAGGEIRHTDHSLEHGPGFGADDIVVFSIGKGLVEIRLGIGARMEEFNKPLQQASFVFFFGGSARRVWVSHSVGGRTCRR